MQIYFRKNPDNIDEYNICSEYFNTVPFRTLLKSDLVDKRVICRYSALPYYSEVERDLNNMGLVPINTFIQHDYIASMGWLEDITEYTFPTYFNLYSIPADAYPLVIKGKTNSRKFEWDTKMFAVDRKQALDITRELNYDPLIGPQGLVYRKYIELETLEIGINGMRMTNEWRCFFYKGILIASDYYWSIIDDLSLIDYDDFNKNGLPFAISIAQKIKENVDFFVIDIAKDITGKWWVVELNDGQMSGLSLIEPELFYTELYKVVKYGVLWD